MGTTLSSKRVDVFFEPHIGFGIRWDSWKYPLHLNIALPFITIGIGFGKAREKY